jgi:uncharacterized protein (TIGR02996 family)
MLEVSNKLAIRERPALAVTGDERFFRDALTRYVTDDAARLLFADWLDDRGDWRAAGYHWMAEHGKQPSMAKPTWDWWHEISENRREIVLPAAIWYALPGLPWSGFPICKEFPSQTAAEEAVCAVIAKTDL